MKPLDIHNWNRNAHHIVYRKELSFKEIFPVVILDITEDFEIIYTADTDHYLLYNKTLQGKTVEESSLRFDHDDGLDDPLEWQVFNYKNADIHFNNFTNYEFFELDVDELVHFI